MFLLGPLTRPHEKPYRLPWATWTFYAGAVISLPLLTFVNVILVGYETSMEHKPTFSPEANVWWARSSVLRRMFKIQPGDCEPAELALGSSLMSNSPLNLFTYTFTRYKYNQTDQRSSTSYRENALGTCRVDSMVLVLKESVPATSFSVESTIQCSEFDKAPAFRSSFRGSNVFVTDQDTVVWYVYHWLNFSLPGYGPPPFNEIPANNTSPANVLGALNVLGADLIMAMTARNQYWRQRANSSGDVPNYKVDLPIQTSIQWEPRENCGGDAQPNQCNDLSITDTRRMLYSWTHLNGNALASKLPAPLYEDINTTMINLLIGVRDAIHFELRNNDIPNIFTGTKSHFNNRIRNDIRAVGMRQAMNWRADTCTWYWGCVPWPEFWAGRLESTSDPVNNLTVPFRLLPEVDRPTTFVTNYLCPIFKLKSTGSLVVSVFTGTFAMSATAYMIFTWIMSILDDKYEERKRERNEALVFLRLVASHRPDRLGYETSADAETAISQVLLLELMKSKSL